MEFQFMYYSNRAIASLIKRGHIWIGWNSRDAVSEADLDWEVCGLDLHLDRLFHVWDGRETVEGDPSDSCVELSALPSYSVQSDEGLVLLPGQFVLCQTREYLRLASLVQGQIQGRSLLGRLGLGVHVTAPLIQAGFEGHLALELYNHGPFPIRLRPYENSERQGLAIAQVCFHPVIGMSRASSKRKRFHRQTSPTGEIKAELTPHYEWRS